MTYSTAQNYRARPKRNRIDRTAPELDDLDPIDGLEDRHGLMRRTWPGATELRAVFAMLTLSTASGCTPLTLRARRVKRLRDAVQKRIEGTPLDIEPPAVSACGSPMCMSCWLAGAHRFVDAVASLPAGPTYWLARAGGYALGPLTEIERRRLRPDGGSRTLIGWMTTFDAVVTKDNHEAPERFEPVAETIAVLSSEGRIQPRLGRGCVEIRELDPEHPGSHWAEILDVPGEHARTIEWKRYPEPTGLLDDFRDMLVSPFTSHRRLADHRGLTTGELADEFIDLNGRIADYVAGQHQQGERMQRIQSATIEKLQRPPRGEPLSQLSAAG